MSAPDHPAGSADELKAWRASERGYRLASWMVAQRDLAAAERTGREVYVTTEDAVYGPCIVQTSRRGMVSLRSGVEVWTLSVVDIESVCWAPPVEPIR